MKEDADNVVRRISFTEHRNSFDVFKSNVCHQVKDLGDLVFIEGLLENDEIHKLYQQEWYPEALYLLAMLDYLCHENNLPLYQYYDDLHHFKLDKLLFPSSVLILTVVSKSDRYKEEALDNAIPEFLQFNIVEGEIRNVC